MLIRYGQSELGVACNFCFQKSKLSAFIIIIIIIIIILS
jgi:hypothetical protein